MCVYRNVKHIRLHYKQPPQVIDNNNNALMRTHFLHIGTLVEESANV
jgi:hypothetical protein